MWVQHALFRNRCWKFTCTQVTNHKPIRSSFRHDSLPTLASAPLGTDAPAVEMICGRTAHDRPRNTWWVGRNHRTSTRNGARQSAVNYCLQACIAFSNCLPRDSKIGSVFNIIAIPPGIATASEKENVSSSKLQRLTDCDQQYRSVDLGRQTFHSH